MDFWAKMPLKFNAIKYYDKSLVRKKKIIKNKYLPWHLNINRRISTQKICICWLRTWTAPTATRRHQVSRCFKIYLPRPELFLLLLHLLLLHRQGRRTKHFRVDLPRPSISATREVIRLLHRLPHVTCSPRLKHRDPRWVKEPVLQSRLLTEEHLLPTSSETDPNLSFNKKQKFLKLQR